MIPTNIRNGIAVTFESDDEVLLSYSDFVRSSACITTRLRLQKSWKPQRLIVVDNSHLRVDIWVE